MMWVYSKLIIRYACMMHMGADESIQNQSGSQVIAKFTIMVSNAGRCLSLLCWHNIENNSI